MKGIVDFYSEDVLGLGEIVRQLDVNTHNCPDAAQDIGHVSDAT